MSKRQADAERHRRYRQTHIDDPVFKEKERKRNHYHYQRSKDELASLLSRLHEKELEVGRLQRKVDQMETTIEDQEWIIHQDEQELLKSQLEADAWANLYMTEQPRRRSMRNPSL